MRVNRWMWATSGILVLGAMAWTARSVLAAEPACGPRIWSRVITQRLMAPFEGATLSAGAAVYTLDLKVTDRDVGKVHVRTERRYAGPLPRPDQLQCLLDHGMADGFYPVLQDTLRQEIAARLVAIECELGVLAQELDFEIEKARLAVQGTADEIVVPEKGPDAEPRKREMHERARGADRNRERWSTVSYPRAQHWFRIARTMFPRVFELEKSQTETSALRQRFLEGQVRELLSKEGVAALDAVRCTTLVGGR